MDPVQSTTVYHCCVWKGGRVLYSYNSTGDREIDNLAAMCLEMIPPYHRWYFETFGKRTFVFLMDGGGYVYFTIADKNLGNPQLLRFLHKLRDEFKRLGGEKVGSTTTSKSSTLSSIRLQEQLLPVFRQLVASLGNASSAATTEWLTEDASPSPSPCSSNAKGHVEDGGASTKAPLLRKPGKQEKKKKQKDHVVAVRDVEIEEHRRSSDRGLQIDLGALASDDKEMLASPLRKDFNGTRSKSSSQNWHKKWCRQVCIVLAIDVLICVALFVIWLVICHGMECII